MKIKKVYNKYIVRKMINYKPYVLSFDNKPSKADIKKALTEKISNLQIKATPEPTTNITTLQETINKYIDIKINVLSPTTIKSYYGAISTLKAASPKLLKINIDDIDNETLQHFINQYSLNHKPKTCINILSNIITPIKYFNPDKTFNIKTPQKIKTQIYIPNKNDIGTLKEYYKGTPYETIFLLSLYGLRQSEIQALTLTDLNPTTNELTINKAKVKGYNNKFYIKTTKTIESNRKIIITDYLKNLILDQNYITKKTYAQFYNDLKKTTQKLNIKYFNPHKLRHYLASELHRLNIPAKYIQALGGWATDNVLKNVYIHTIENETQEINKKLNDILF